MTEIDERAGTRERSLEAAERLFVAHGYDGTSLRAIAGLAKVNLGSLVYYFGTKEALFSALCEERLSATIAAQRDALLACEARLDAGERVTLREAIGALVLPALSPNEPGVDLAGLYARIFTDPSEAVLAIGKALFSEPSMLMRRLARRLLPDLDEAEFHWRYVGSISALIITQGFVDRMATVSGTPQPPLSREQLGETIIGVIERGLGG
ncbi:MAG TPA: TetR family transcriptional regulator [Sphingomonadaceae bacterium]|nr:TetR family transcriptional regulator [Sphingomonadaceae bacterium]